MPYLLLSLLLVLAEPPQYVSVEVSSSTTGGKVYLAAYDTPDGFRNDDFVVNASTEFPDRASSAELDLQLPSGGTYVIAAFQDMNDNGELDRNFFGVPTEPYGFAKLPPSKWRTPSFGEVATEVNEPTERLKIVVRRWSEY